MSLVHTPAQAKLVSKVQIMARNEDKQLSTKGCPRQKTNGVLTRVQRANDYIREDRSTEREMGGTSD